jgi:hypothetical protein
MPAKKKSVRYIFFLAKKVSFDNQKKGGLFFGEKA